MSIAYEHVSFNLYNNSSFVTHMINKSCTKLIQRRYTPRNMCNTMFIAVQKVAVGDVGLPQYHPLLLFARLLFCLLRFSR